MRPIRPIGLIEPIRPMRPISPMRLIGLIGLMSLMSACSNEPEPVEPEPLQTAIAFSGNMQEQEEMTRAATPLEEISTTFHAWGYKNDGYENSSYTSYQLVMSDYTVNWTNNSAYTTTSNTNNWEYVGQGDEQSIKYWDWSVKAYRFFGYVPGKGTAAVHEDPEDNESAIVTPAVEPATVTALGGSPIDVPTATEVTLTASIDGSTEATRNAAPYFSQLWFSTGNITYFPDKLFGKPVELHFIKPFAKVRFLFTASEGLTLDHSTLSDISFHPSNGANVPTRGNLTVSYPLKGTATTESWITSVKDGVKSLNEEWTETNEKWYYVLPILSQDSYTVEVSVGGKQIQTAVVPAEYMSWKPGFQYTYMFKITDEGEVTFDLVQVAINNWTEGGEPKDHIVYNW